MGNASIPIVFVAKKLLSLQLIIPETARAPFLESPYTSLSKTTWH